MDIRLHCAARSQHQFLKTGRGSRVDGLKRRLRPRYLDSGLASFGAAEQTKRWGRTELPPEEGALEGEKPRPCPPRDLKVPRKVPKVPPNILPFSSIHI